MNKTLEEIKKKMTDLEPISEEEYNLWAKSEPALKMVIYKTYDEYMKSANLSPEEKEKMKSACDCLNLTIDELAKKDKRWRKGFFSKRS